MAIYTNVSNCENQGDIYYVNTTYSSGQIAGYNGDTVTNCAENGTLSKYSE